MLGKKAGDDERVGAARHQHNGLALAQAGAGRGRALGVGGSREQIELVLLEERRKVGAIQKNGYLYRGQPRPQCVNGLLRGQAAVIAQAVFGLGAGAGLCKFLPPVSRCGTAAAAAKCYCAKAR